MLLSKLNIKVILSTIIVFPILAEAACITTNGGLPGNTIRVGSKTDISIYKIEYQPEGTRLALDYISPADISAQTGIPVERVLFQCDLADKDSIYEMYYMPPGGLDNGTPFATLNGIRYWKTNMRGLMFNFFIGNGVDKDTQFNNSSQRKKIGYDVDPNNSQRIQIKLKHFSGISNEQVRSNETVTANAYLPAIGLANRGVIGFSGPGINTGATMGGNYLNIAQRIVNGRVINSCGIQQITSTVNLGSHSVNSLPSAPVNFNVTLECQRGATRVRYGFVPSEANRASNEQNYLLLDPSMGSTAKGVAIQISTAGGTAVRLLNLGAAGGGIPVTNNWTNVPVQTGTGTQVISLDFNAKYVRYPTEPIAPGRANSKAIFMIDMQ
ncbi:MULTISPECIES: fimbrial protein [Providencia]|uniref:Fimbrial-type adhesion domain-containing protein n=1 Tax=Providencia stuartii TaxID=588 RepID=A0A1S1HRW5_PROST|nr:fimbrial protein [Providencia stuartii]OHT24747.1 hypothetical protein A3Q29_03330 [Providencia stuartii]